MIKISPLILTICLGCNNQAPQRIISLLREDRQIVIKESGDTAITSISSVSFSPSGQKVLLIDGQQGAAIVISLPNDSVEQFLRCPKGFSDSLAENAILPPYGGSKYISYAKAVRLQPQIAKEILNGYTTGCYLSDTSIAILGDVRAMVSFDGPQKKLILDHRMFVLNSSTAGQFVWFPEELPGDPDVAQRGVLLYDKNRKQFTLATANHQAVRYGQFSKASTLASFDFHGKKISTLAFLPEEAWNSSLGYSFLQPVAVIDSSFNDVIGYSLIPKIFNLDTHSEFSLRGFDNLNDRFFQLMKSHVRVSADSLMSTVDFRIRDMQVSSYGKYEIILEHGIRDTSEWEVQEYSPNGDLLRDAFLPKDKLRGKPQFVSYDSKLDEFTCLSISNSQHWLLTFYKW